MLSKTSFPKTWPVVEYDWDMQLLNTLVELAFEGRTKVAQDYEAKELLKHGVVTLTDGVDRETFTLQLFVYTRLPYILFSNNRWYINAWRKSCIYHNKPVYHLYGMVRRYYKQFKDINI